MEKPKEMIEVSEMEDDKANISKEINNEVKGHDGESEKKSQPEKVEYKINMDEAMKKLDVPCRKIVGKQNAYLLALDTKEQTEETVLKIQQLTKVTWSVKQTRKFQPCIKKRPLKPITLFKRQYGCHMSTRTRAKTKRIRYKKSRNINCPAQLMVTIKTFVASTRTKPKRAMFDKEFPCSFEFRYHHNHLVDVVDALTTRPLGDDIKDAICKLLDKGHSCASAYHTLYTIKVEDFGVHYKTKMTDRYHFPKRHDLAPIYKGQGYKQKFERFYDVSFTTKNLEEVLLSYQKKNGTLYRISVNDQTIVICLCTPLMQRAIQQVSDVLFIDPSPEEYKEYKTYFLLTQSPAGALPISCILTNKHEMFAFREGMKLFFEMVEIQPAIVLTNAAISFYHALSSAWKALYETRHELARAKKESYYQLFREVVFADSEEGLVVARQVLAVECAHLKFLLYIDKMYENISLWSLYYRQYIVLHNSEPFDYNEAELSLRLFRLMSKIALDRTKLFNINQITDFMCSAFEKYFRNRILEIALGRKSQVIEERYGRPSEDAPHMEDIGHHQYLFTKSVPEVLDEYYQADMITHLCTCGLGTLGKHCPHVAEILAKENVFSPELTMEQKSSIYFIATGILKHTNSFLPERTLSLMEEEDVLLCPSPETILGPEDPDAGAPDYEAIKSQWISYCNKIVKLMEHDPDRFLPAINVHLDNIKKYSTSVPMLLKGLYTGFPYMGNNDTLPPLTIINSKSSASITQNKPKTINMKQEPKDANMNIPNCCPPLLTTMQKLPNKLKPIRAHIGLEHSSKSSWNNNLSTMTIDNCQEEDKKQNIPILEATVDSLVQPKNGISQLKAKTVNFADTLTLNQLPNGTTLFDGNGPKMFEIQKGIFVDQAALDHLTQNEVAVLDEKKGILIIPMPPD